MNMTGVRQMEKVGVVWTGCPGDADAFERALRLCYRTKAALSIVAAMERSPTPIIDRPSVWGPVSGTTDVNEDRPAELRRLIEMARRENVQTSCEVLQGDDSLELFDRIKKEGCDIVVKAAQPLTLAQRTYFGHADDRFLRMSPCSVWITKPSGNSGRKRILAAVDAAPSYGQFDADSIRKDLDRAVIEFAVLAAQIEEADLQVVNVWEFDLELPLQSRAGFAPAGVAEVETTLRQKHERSLTQLLAPYNRRISRVHLLKGNAANEVARLATNESIDAIVMGTVSRSGIAGWLFGNTAEKVLIQSECSLVTVKPCRFSSRDCAL